MKANILEPLVEAISPLKVRGSMEIWGVIEVMVMIMVMAILRAMLSHILEVLSICWSGVVFLSWFGSGFGS